MVVRCFNLTDDVSLEEHTRVHACVLVWSCESAAGESQGGQPNPPGSPHITSRSGATRVPARHSQAELCWPRHCSSALCQRGQGPRVGGNPRGDLDSPGSLASANPLCFGSTRHHAYSLRIPGSVRIALRLARRPKEEAASRGRGSSESGLVASAQQLTQSSSRDSSLSPREGSWPGRLSSLVGC